MKSKNKKGLTVNFNSATVERPKTAIEELNEQYASLLDNIAYYEGLDEDDEEALSEEEAEEYRANLEKEYAVQLADILGYEDEEDEDAEYSDNSALATFSAGTSFGQALLELADEEYEDPLEGLALAAEHAGLNEEQLIGLIEGRYYPTEELALRLAEVFETTSNDEEYLDAFLGLAEEASADADEDEEDGEEDAEYSAYQAELAKIKSENERLQAEFSAAQTEAAINNELASIQQRASDGVNSRWLPPAAKQILMASFKSDTDRLAAFSTMCEQNEVDPATQLFAMNYALEIFERCGDYGMFSQIAEIPLTDEEAEFAAAEEDVAEASFLAYRKANPLPKE